MRDTFPDAVPVTFPVRFPTKEGAVCAAVNTFEEDNKGIAVVSTARVTVPVVPPPVSPVLAVTPVIVPDPIPTVVPMYTSRVEHWLKVAQTFSTTRVPPLT